MKMCMEPEIAKEVGLASAHILEYIYYWVNHNKKKNINFNDGKYWTYFSVKNLEEKDFYFLTYNQIRRALEKLENKGFIEVGNYNKANYDKTKWYTLTEKSYNILNKPLSKMPKDKAKATEGAIVKNAKPIPVNKCNKGINENNGFFTKNSTSEKTIDFDMLIIQIDNICYELGIEDIDFKGACLELVKYYVITYKKRLNKKYPAISNKTLQKIIIKLHSGANNDFGDEIVSPLSSQSLIDYKNIIDQHFKTDYKGKTDYNLAHFISGEIMKNRYYDIF